MRTIQEIEHLQFESLTRKQLTKLRIDLRNAFYFTNFKDKLSDGRPAKEIIGNQYTRITEFLIKVYNENSK